MIERLLELLKERGVTASKLTTDLELSNSSVSEWKKGKGKPSADAIVKIADYFDVSTDYLLTGKETAASLSPDTQELVDAYEKLDGQGKTMVKAKAFEELRRLED